MTTTGLLDVTPSNGRGWLEPAVDRQPLQASSTRQRRVSLTGGAPPREAVDVGREGAFHARAARLAGAPGGSGGGPQKPLPSLCRSSIASLSCRPRRLVCEPRIA